MPNSPLTHGKIRKRMKARAMSQHRKTSSKPRLENLNLPSCEIRTDRFRFAGHRNHAIISLPPQPDSSPVIIPPHLLEADTLTRLLEDFVTREGTDNGDDTPLSTRVEKARSALAKGDAVIVFNPLDEQCALMLKNEVPRELMAEWQAE